MHPSTDLERWHLPALLLDRQARVLRRNEAARALLARHTDLLLEHGGVLRSPQSATLLDNHLAALHSAAWQRGTALSPPSAVLVLQRSGQLPLTLRSQPWGPAAGVVLMALCDPQAYSLHQPTLKALFSLTSSEARVAAAVADGLSTAEIARSLGVQLNTVQAHLKRLLAKTGTAHQARLVSLLWRSVAVQATAWAQPPLNAGAPQNDRPGRAQMGNDASSNAPDTARAWAAAPLDPPRWPASFDA